ncbi:hypothetical protein [Emcibacter sp.]|uniref:hypothetical protein n=1 Tax=Emcibacter sp. TaxID=1979954 RepID=UPI002AA95C27|nr:hypothetical protein [Emcibacter sp.]
MEIKTNSVFLLRIPIFHIYYGFICIRGETVPSCRNILVFILFLPFQIVNATEKEMESSGEDFHICIPIEITYAVELRNMVVSSYRKLGRDVEWHILPVNRCVSMVSEGVLDADIGRSSIVAEKFSNLVVVPVQLFTADINLYARKKVRQSLPEAEALLIDKSLAIGYPAEILYVVNMIDNDKSIGVRNGEQMISLLRKGRVDFILLPQAEQKRLQNEGFPLDDLHLVKEGYIKIPAFHILNSKHKTLAADLAKLFRNHLNSRDLSPR